MLVAHRYTVVSLVLTLLCLGCVPHQGAVSRLTAAADGEAITFHNRDRQLIQVYLIDETRAWWLGRLEPLASARLRLPVSFSTTSTRSIRLAVIGGSSRSLEPSQDRRAVFSLNERASNVAGQDWIFANGQLLGPGSNETREP